MTSWIIAAAILVTVLFVLLRGPKRRRRRGSSGQLGHAMQNLEGLFVESKRHVIEVQRDTRADEDDSGDPPGKK